MCALGCCPGRLIGKRRGCAATHRTPYTRPALPFGAVYTRAVKAARIEAQRTWSHLAAVASR